MKTTNKLLSLTAFVAAAMSFALPAWATDYEWTGNGTDTNWNTDENWSETGWVNGSDSNAYFPYYGEGGDSVGNKEVTISSEIVAGKVTIGDTYTFTLTSEGSLTMTELAPGTDPHLTIAGEGTVLIGENNPSAFVLKGLLTIAGSEVTFHGGIDLEGGTMEITGGSVTFVATGTTATYLSGDGTIAISGGNASFEGVTRVGYDSDGTTSTITIGSADDDTGSSVEVTFSGAVYVGETASCTGVIEIYSGNTTFSTTVYVGSYGTGKLNISGGENEFETVYVGSGSGSEGKITISDGTNEFNGNNVYVGNSGTGYLNISGGTNTFSSDTTVYLGYSSGGSGTINISGGDTTFSSEVRVGQNASGEGTINISGGETTFEKTVSVGYNGNGTMEISGKETKTTFSGNVYIGRMSTSTSKMTIEGGDNTFSGSVYVGNSGTGTMEISGGTNEFKGSSLYVGSGSNSEGKITITGGENKFSSSTTVYVGNAGTGTINISGGETTFSGTVRLGYNSAGSGTITIGGEETKTTFSGSVYVGNAGTGELTISGGTNTFSGNNLYVGYSSAGTLEITDGTTEFSSTLNIGRTNSGTDYAGTVTITGGNTTFSGTTTIANNDSKLTVSGGTLTIEKQIGTTTNGSVTGSVKFSDTGKLIISGDLLKSIEELVESGNDGSIPVICANTITFGDVEITSETTGLDSKINPYVSAGNYELTWSYSSGTLYVTSARIIPEPSMFGMLLGISALALTATRRRHRRQYRKAA